MEFPHLSDTSFPLLNNANVYSYRNVFDYTRWVPNTRVRLTNVLWSGDYSDVVDFKTDEERDSWFDNKENVYDIILTSNHSVPPEGGIKLPIPYDIACRYNYIVVDIPVMTSESAPIEYENIERGIRRWFFFIDEVSSRAPNTTMFMISLDVWTQFKNDVYIKYMFLERGHAPVAATDTDTYLSNPIANNDYLLTPDVTPTNSSVCRKSKMIPFGNGEKYVCIASTVSAPLMPYITEISHNNPDYSYGNVTYSDVNARYGYQLQVNGYGVGNGSDLSGVTLPAQPVVTASADGRIGNNLTIWAIPATEVYGDGRFFETVIYKCPQFMNSIKACFIVDVSMISIRASYELAGYTIYEVYGNQKSVDIELKKSDFGFPARYERFAKLYTFPYSEIELTDNSGKTVSVRIENTGSIEANLITSVAFPFVNNRMFFTGINGVGSDSYEWVNLWDTTIECEISNSDWFTYCFDNQIPCFALYMDGETAWYLDNFNRSVRGARRNALVNYHNSVRSANTSMQNAIDSSATDKSNTLANDATMYDNADADATTLVNNTANTTATNTANTNATVATNVSKTNNSNTIALDIEDLGERKQNVVTTYSNNTSISTTQTNNETTAATTLNDGNYAMLGAAGNAIIGGALLAGMAGGAAGSAVAPGPGTLAGALGGMAIGGISGLINSGASWGASSSNATIITQANSTVTQATTNLNNNVSTANNSYNAGVTSDLNDERTFNTNADNNLLASNTTRSNDNMTVNNGNTASTMRSNALRSKNTGDSNATALDATNSANYGYTRETSILNAKETLENSRDSVMFSMRDAANSAARVYGEYLGNASPDYYMTNGVQFKIKTMPNAEVRQVGDWFARFGYALEQVWDVNESGLCPMKHFCYWKCRDAWVDDMDASNNAAVEMISSILVRGVTVWKNPDEVGKVSVYDN